MKFRRALQRYGRTPEPETPYQRAGQLWDERIGAARVQAKNWRLMAFGGLFLTIGLSSALVWQSIKCETVGKVPGQAAQLLFWILFTMVVAGAGLMGLVRAIEWWIGN